MPKAKKVPADIRDDDDLSADPVAMLKEDHEKAKHLFDEFEDAEDDEARGDVVKTALRELTVHAALEEEIFYPAVREKLGDDDMMDEALEEHHFAKVAIAELEKMQPGDERFDAKFRVLAEMVRHHIEEEESELLPEAERLGLDLAGLARRMASRKLELQEAAPEAAKRSAKAGGAAKSAKDAAAKPKKSAKSGEAKKKSAKKK